MSQTPSTPVKVPSSAADYTPATLDPDLRSQINTILLRDGHVPKYDSSPSLALLTAATLRKHSFLLTRPLPPPRRIQERLLHALNADSSNWPTAIQNHALQLLRSGEVITFPALLRRVLDDVQEASAKASSSTNGKTATTNGTTTITTDKDAKPSLAVPQAVVEETIRVTKECLESVCEIDD